MSLDTATNDSRLAPLVAGFYAEAPEAVRLKLLRAMLRPVGPLALVAIAAGAFARLLPTTRWHVAEVSAEDVRGISAEQVLDLARYVEQKSPELLTQLPGLVGSPQVWMASVSGAVLLLALKAWQNRRS